MQSRLTTTTVARLGGSALAILALAGQVPATAQAGTIQPGLLITLDGGDVQGQVNDETREFLGIPYAEPPVGPLRWRPPVPASPWMGTLMADEYSAGCPQNGGSIIGAASTNEDCLYLNVWTPDPAPSEPRPVMFWIHGGGNTTGSTGDFVPFPPYTDYRLYDGHTIAQDGNVVVVSVNYRLGVFGFFGHSALAGEDVGFPYAGNQGLLDQNLALQWVQDNIMAFGGDPNNVTIFGESAGSFDVCAHVASPMSAGLFHKAIGQSGGCTVSTDTAETAAMQADAVADAVGCGMAPDVLDCLRGVDVQDLLDNATAGDGGGTGENLGISIDGGFLDQDPRDAFNAGEVSLVPYILGANDDEGTIFLFGGDSVETEEEYQMLLLDRFGAFAPEVEAVYPASDFDTPDDALARVVGDSTLVCTTYDTANRFSRIKKSKARIYHFSHVTGLAEGLGLGAFHGVEIAFVFGSVPPTTNLEGVLGRSMREYWTSFATKAKPKAKARPGWPKFKGKSKKWKSLRFDLQITKDKSFRQAECLLWFDYYENYL